MPFRIIVAIFPFRWVGSAWSNERQPGSGVIWRHFSTPVMAQCAVCVCHFITKPT
jgi:hypothetical protein